MEFVQQVAFYTGITAVLLLFVGLIKPWVMVWWEDVQNRRKVIKIYGSVTVISFLVYLLLFLA